MDLSPLATLKDTDASVRNTAGLAVVLIDDANAAAVVPIVTANLDDKDAEVRRGAAYTLGQIGPPAKTAPFVVCSVRTMRRPRFPRQ